MACQLMVRNDQPDNETLWGYGGWNSTDPGDDTGYVNIFPEQLIQLGPGEDLYSSVINWPSAAVVEEFSQEPGTEAINWLDANVTGLIETIGDNSYMHRMTEHLEGDNSQTHYIYSVIDVTPDSSSSTASLQDIFGSQLTKSTYYQLELAQDSPLVVKGGTLSTTEVSSTEDIPFDPGVAAIFFEVPISSPSVSATAQYALPGVTGRDAVLAVHATHWDGKPLTIRVDGSSVGLPSEIFLHDDGLDGDLTAGDDNYTWSGPSAASSSGPHSLPTVAIGSDGLRFYEDLLVEVVEETHTRYENKSQDTNLNYLGQPYSSVTLDFDGHAPQDMFISFVEQPGQLFTAYDLNNDSHVPVFHKVNFQGFPDGPPPTGLLGLAVADMDNDGHDDLFAASVDEPRLYAGSSTAVFHDLTHSVGLDTLATGSTTGSWADFDRDGQVDLFIGRSGLVPGLEPCYGVSAESDILARNDLDLGTGFPDVSQSAGITAANATNCMAACWADIDDDGDQDLFVGEANEMNIGNPPYFHSSLYINDGMGVFSQECAARFGDFPPIWVNGATFQDMDNDGDLDLVLSLHFTSSTVFFNDGSGNFSNQIQLPTNGLTGGVKVFDHNLNGHADVLLLPDDPNLGDDAHLPGLEVALFGNYLTDPIPSFKDLSPQVELRLSGKIGGAVANDFNTDGDLDLFLGRPVAEHEFFFRSVAETRSDEPINHWLEVELDSPDQINNRRGVGAKVTVLAGTTARSILVDGGSGRGGQDSHVLTFGLGNSSFIQSITVDWPNGYHQVVDGSGISLDTRIVIEDQSVFQIVPGSVSFTYKIVPSTGQVDWVFDWKTNHYSLGTLDRIDFDTAGISYDCYEGITFLVPGMQNVSNSVDLLTDGQAQHEIIWRRDCAPNCIMPFTATSGLTSPVTRSDDGLVNVKICPVTQPNGGM